MREIKFRGKVKWNGNHKFKGDWIYGYYRNNENGNAFITETVDDFDNYIFNETEIDENTIGQYIGLKDKNGKEIYEGDIIQDAWKINMVVKYINTGFYLCRKNVNGEYTKISNWRNLNTKQIIGNIYENLELLKEE